MGTVPGAGRKVTQPRRTRADAEGMPRIARFHIDGCLVHVVATFVNRDFLMPDDAARAAFLRRLERSLRRSDWRLIGYCLMSSHVHLVFITGKGSLEAWAKPLNTGFASYVNRRGKPGGGERRGPVFAERPREIFMPMKRALPLVTYVHNNPVRAGVVATPEQSSWSSHRAIIGDEPAPTFLHVTEALALFGFGAGAADRLKFHEGVLSCADDPHDPTMSCTNISEQRAALRARSGTGVEMASPIVDVETTITPLSATTAVTFERLGYRGSAEDLLAIVARVTDVSIARMRSRSRRRPDAAARHLAVRAWARLDRRMSEMAAALGISRSAASQIANAQSILKAAEPMLQAVLDMALERDLSLGGTG